MNMKRGKDGQISKHANDKIVPSQDQLQEAIEWNDRRKVILFGYGHMGYIRTTIWFGLFSPSSSVSVNASTIMRILCGVSVNLCNESSVDVRPEPLMA